MWNGSCNILDDSSAEICSPSKSEDVEVFNMIAGISESGTLIKHIPYNCKGKFDGTKRNSKQKWSKNKRQYEFI